jgi:MFS family permease
MTDTAADRTRTPPKPGSARAALAYRDFRLVWIGLFLSNIGTWMQNLALPAYVDARTESAAIVGILLFAQLGPLLLLSIPGGIIADKVPRKPWLISMQWVQLVFSVVLAAIVSVDGPLWGLFGAQLAIGVANALNAPAFQASIPMLVDRRDLPGAISLNSVMLNGSRVVGPAIAAVLGLWGVTTAQLFLVNAATYLFLIIALVSVRVPDVRAEHTETGWRRALTGVRIARSRRVLSRLLVSMFGFSFFSLVYVALYASVVRLNFGINPKGPTFKWLYAVWGLGAMLGALAVGTVLVHLDRRKLIVAGFTGFAVSLAAYALIRSPGPAFPVGLVLGFCYFLTATSMITIFQQNLRDTERASVMPLWFMAFGGSVTLGGLAFGKLVDEIGARWVMLGGAAFALYLAWWCDLRRLAPDDFLDEEGDHALEPGHPAALDEDGIAAGE